MSYTKNSLVKDFFPIWFFWYRTLKIPESQRAGKPRKAVLPIGGKKYQAAAMMLLFPRGIKTADKLAKEVGSSGGTLRNWMIEDRFKALVKDLESQFAAYILQNLGDKTFFEEIYASHDEIESWSDGVLRTLIFNIDNEVGVGDSLDLTLSNRLLKAYGHRQPDMPDNLDAAEIPRIKVPSPSKPDVKEMWRDIGNAALESFQTWPKSKRGPRPPEIREMERSALYRFTMTLKDHLHEMDQALQSKKTKLELKAMIKTAQLILYNMIEELKD
jgi:hypothetical protein